MKNNSPPPLFLFFLFITCTTSIPHEEIIPNCGGSDAHVCVGSFAASTDSTDHSSHCPSVAVYDSVETFPLRLPPGRFFLRFTFRPCDYGRDASNAVFSVTFGRVTLLRNFSPYEAAKARNLTALSFEYSAYVTEQVTNLTFVPSASRHGAYAFQNGIDGWSVRETFDAVDPGRALQTAYRLNVGGSAVSPDDDSGLFRAWEADSAYVRRPGVGVAYAKDPNLTIRYSWGLPEYIAPAAVYATARSMGPDGGLNLKYNLTWAMPVDCGFGYLVRLHLCEIQSVFAKPNMRVFNVYVDGTMVDGGVDVVAVSGGVGRPAYKDYRVAVGGCGSTGMTDMVVELQPDASTEPEYLDVILNGLEVFKIQDGNNSLAGPRVWY